MRKRDTLSADQPDMTQSRSNPDRYFHIMTKGWYIFTREGIKGPFYDKSRAALFLQHHIYEPAETPDPSEWWR